MLETLFYYIVQACTVAVLGYSIMSISSKQTAIFGLSTFVMLLFMDQIFFRYIVPERFLIDTDTAPGTLGTLGTLENKMENLGTSMENLGIRGLGTLENKMENLGTSMENLGTSEIDKVRQDVSSLQSGSGRSDESILYGQFGKPYEVPTF